MDKCPFDYLLNYLFKNSICIGQFFSEHVNSNDQAKIIRVLCVSRKGRK